MGLLINITSRGIINQSLFASLRACALHTFRPTFCFLHKVNYHENIALCWNYCWNMAIDIMFIDKSCPSSEYNWYGNWYTHLWMSRREEIHRTVLAKKLKMEMQNPLSISVSSRWLPEPFWINAVYLCIPEDTYMFSRKFFFFFFFFKFRTHIICCEMMVKFDLGRLLCPSQNT